MESPTFAAVPSAAIRAQSIHAYADRIETWVRNELPSLNRAIEEDITSPETLIAAFRGLIHELLDQVELSKPGMSRQEARKLIQLLGFGLSSIERHIQARREPAGSGLAMLPRIDPLLVALSQVAQHPPRDSHYTYWLWNDGKEPLTFTGDPQEVFFNRVVNNTDRLHTASCNAIRPISEGSMNVVSTSALTAIEQATHNTMELVKHYRSFMSKDETLGRRSMEPWFFMTRMRTYLPTYPIQGTIWDGVNAANVASQMQLDYLTGNVNQGYAKIVQMRLRFLTEEDRNALESDMKLPSVFDVLIRTMRLTIADIESIDDEALAKHISQQSGELRRALVGYKGLFNAAAQLTATHWALIQNYLVKPAASLTAQEKAKMAVPPDHGTGGKTHAQTEAIMRMRREHPAITKLLDRVTLETDTATA